MSKQQTELSGRDESIFYGYSTHSIIRWCGVSKVTAGKWKKGTRKPSARSIRIFLLYRFGQVISKVFKGWMFNDKSGNIVTPTGREFSPGDIESIPLLYQEISELKNKNRQLQEEIFHLSLKNDELMLCDSERRKNDFSLVKKQILNLLDEKNIESHKTLLSK
jgi:FtsZ-binding cell division protein ZapB